ncbi:MAG: histidine kinase [Leptospirales bacterium]|nr:histidine kinase [Leptospirales bacterium]
MGALQEDLSVGDFESKFAVVRDRESILAQVNAGRPLTLLTSDLSDDLEHQLDFLVAALLKRYRREGLQAALYTALKEIVINATKANAKLAWFREQGLDIQDEGQYRLGIQRLAGHYDERWIVRYGELARKMDLQVQIQVHHCADGLRVEVSNAPLSRFEERRVREKFREGMRYEDLVSFYMANADQQEGEGIGLALIVLLLKAEGVNPHLFRVGVNGGATVARLEIPLSPAFESVRGRNPAGHAA